MSAHLLFVYGTLKEGGGNHWLLGQSQCLGKGETAKKYAMHASYGFPTVVDRHGLYPISGELYDIDEMTLRDIDRLEGHPNFYERRLTEIFMPELGQKRIAWMYFGRPTGRTQWMTGGSWPECLSS